MDSRPPTPSKDVSLQRVGDEAILHDRRNGRAHVINESAARIWDLCDGQHTLDQIAFNLVDKNDPATLEYLIRDYLDHLRHHLDQIFAEVTE